MKYLLAGFIMSMLCCNTPGEKKTPGIIYLEKLKHRGAINVNGELKQGLYQYALVEQAPEQADSLKHIFLAYCDSLVNKNTIEKNYYRYFIKFYKRSPNTESYLHAKEDFWDQHNDIGQESVDDYLGEYRYEKCPADSSKGKWTIETHVKADFHTEVLSGNCP